MSTIVPSPPGSKPINLGAVTSATLQNAQTGNANGTDYDITGMATVQILVNPTAWTGTVTFWASIDGTIFNKIKGNQMDTQTYADNVANPSSTTSIWTFQTAGLTKIRAVTSSAGGTSVTVTGAASPFPNTSPLGITLSSTVLAAGTALAGGVNVVDSAGTNKLAVGTSGNALISNFGGTKATYTYAIPATAPYATPTDWIVIRGSASKTVKIWRVEISGAATAATEVIFTLNKHTVANTGGTSTTPTPMKHDSADGAATAVVLLYSVAPTIDASATIWKTVRMDLAVAPAATAASPDRYIYNYATEPYEPLTLRGVAQEFAINFASAAVPSGGVYDVAIVFSEES